MIKAKPVFLFLFLLAGLLNVQAQEAVVKKIHDRLVSYFEHHSTERICLITDKEVYKPGEAILFQALAGSMSRPGVYPVDAVLKLNLYDASGKVCAEGEAEVKKGTAAGNLEIPAGLAAGKYVLEAHFSTISQEEEAFMKLVFIDPMNEAEMVFDRQKVPTLLIAGESHPVILALHDLLGKAVSDRKLSYELLEEDSVLASGKLKTDDSGVLSFDLDVPEKEYKYPLQLRISDSKNIQYTQWFHVNTEKLKLAFYAESGPFVAGVPLRAGFRVTTAAGQPVDIMAEISGEEGRIVSQARTLIPGYGMFPLVTRTGEACRFVITSELGEGQRFDLPAFDPGGFIFSIPRTDREFISGTLMFTDSREQPVQLLLTRGKTLFWASTVKISGSGRIKIPKEGIPEGICLLSAYDSQGKLLGERLLYVGGTGDWQLSAEAEPAGKDQHLLIKAVPVNRADSARITVSVSALVKNAGSDDDFRTSFLLNSLVANQLTGGAGLKKEDVLNENILNFLLISNHLRNYSWQSVLNFEATGSSDKKWLAGEVLDNAGEPVQNAKVSLVHTGQAQMMNATADAGGHFVFPGLDPLKTNEYVLKAIAPDGNDKLTISFDKDLAERLSLQATRFLKANLFVEKPEVPRQFFTDNQFLYSKVRRKAPAEPPKSDSYLKLLYSGSSIMDVIKMIKPYQIVDGDKIVFPGGSNSLIAQDGALIVIDGQKMGTSASVINTISPHDVQSINISTSPVEISRYTGLNSVGLIEISTRRGQMVEKPKSNENDNQEFKGDKQQTTLYWSSDLHLNESGEVRVQIPETQIKGDFLVKVRAIDQTGRIGQLEKVIRME